VGKYDFFYYLGLVTQVGLTVIFSVLAGLAIGMFLDRVFNTKGVFTVFFIISGILGGAFVVYKEIMKGIK
jgi:F0F1-type ATP synthase assembly protein I